MLNYFPELSKAVTLVEKQVEPTEPRVWLSHKGEAPVEFPGKCMEWPHTKACLWHPPILPILLSPQQRLSAAWRRGDTGLGQASKIPEDGKNRASEGGVRRNPLGEIIVFTMGGVCSSQEKWVLWYLGISRNRDASSCSPISPLCLPLQTLLTQLQSILPSPSLRCFPRWVAANEKPVLWCLKKKTQNPETLHHWMLCGLAVLSSGAPCLGAHSWVQASLLSRWSFHSCSITSACHPWEQGLPLSLLYPSYWLQDSFCPSLVKSLPFRYSLVLFPVWFWEEIGERSSYYAAILQPSCSLFFFFLAAFMIQLKCWAFVAKIVLCIKVKILTIFPWT